MYRSQLKTVLRQFDRIPDPRNPKKIKHKQTVLILYGMLCFAYQMSSRRQANKEMSRPAFFAALHALFPELETLPHADTLARVLKTIDPQSLEDAHIKRLNRYIRNKKFNRYLIDGCYPIAVDGTQKLVRKGDHWEDEWLRRKIGKEENGNIQRYVYVLEANLVFRNGMTLPIMSEFLFYEENKDKDTEKEKDKQDCEIKGFKRLAKRLKKHFSRLSMMLLLDGLYPNETVMELCKQYNWQHMIVLQEKSLTTVWAEFYGLKTLPTEQENHFLRDWKGRKQTFTWVNNIRYEYHTSGTRWNAVHLVICEEEWKEIEVWEEEGKEIEKIVTKKSRHAWISSEPINRNNVHERCNLGARQRWGIENSLMTEKKRGYYYEHAFSYDWNAMRCYHLLMRMVHLLNELVQGTKKGKKYIRQLGLAGYWEFVKSTLTGLWLTSEWTAKLVRTSFQLRLE